MASRFHKSPSPHGQVIIYMRKLKSREMAMIKRKGEKKDDNVDDEKEEKRYSRDERPCQVITISKQYQSSHHCHYLYPMIAELINLPLNAFLNGL